MADIRQEADAAAQAAFRELVDSRIATGVWNPTLTNRYLAAERMVEDVEAIAALDRLTDDQRTVIPTIPLEWTPGELTAGWGK